MKRVICTALSMAVTASAALSINAVVNAKATAKLSGTITYLTHRTDKADNVIKDLANDFEKKNPGVKIKIESVSGDQMTQVMKTRMAANELPDITPVLGTIQKKDYKKYFLAIDDLGFNDKNLYCYKDGLGTDGKLYTMTHTVGYNGIVYNRNAFKKAGISKVPRTWKEFEADCAKLKDKGIIPLASNYKDKWPLNMYSNDNIFAASELGDVNYTNNFAKKKEILSNDGGMLKAFDFLRDMYKKGYLEPDLMSTNWDSMKKQHAQGKIAMAFLGTWYPPQVVENGAKAEDVGMFPLPESKGLIMGPDWFYAVAKNSKAPKVAKAFLKYMWDDGRFADAIGVIPPLKNAKIKNFACKELLSFNVPIIQSVTATDAYNKALNKFQTQFADILQEYILASDTKAVIKKYNDKWASCIK